jgi:hypothetical protein
MIWDARGGRYTLSTGRRFHANNGILGLGPTADFDGIVAEGYDGGIITDGREVDARHSPEEAAEASAWTAEERAELAAEMIARWTAFARGRS